ncbi:hypothetical protein AOLI_G00038710 [Acnodon oligacanthus]
MPTCPTSQASELLQSVSDNDEVYMRGEPGFYGHQGHSWRGQNGGLEDLAGKSDEPLGRTELQRPSGDLSWPLYNPFDGDVMASSVIYSVLESLVVTFLCGSLKAIPPPQAIQDCLRCH